MYLENPPVFTDLVIEFLGATERSLSSPSNPRPESKLALTGEQMKPQLVFLLVLGLSTLVCTQGTQKLSSLTRPGQHLWLVR